MSDNGKFGRLLTHVIDRMDKASDQAERGLIASHVSGSEADDKLPIVIKLYSDKPEPGEPWAAYRERIGAKLKPLGEKLDAVMGIVPSVIGRLVSSDLQTIFRLRRRGDARRGAVLLSAVGARASRRGRRLIGAAA